MSSHCFYRGQISTSMHLLRGQLSSPVNCLGGRYPHMPFFIGGQMSGGGGCPAPVINDYFQLLLIYFSAQL